jgi:copper homeostasis protein
VTLIEACVGSLGESVAAEQGGARRLELCDRLDVGGTTPTSGVIDDVKRRVRIPVSVMIRPRGGSFVHSGAELEQMRRDLDVALEHGADMVVIGVLDDRGDVHAAFTRELVDRAKGIPVTFHRAFDEVRDQSAALEKLIDAGISRVLTGGGPGPAIDSVNRLSELVSQSSGRITIMAGGKVRGQNARTIVEKSGVREVHARCELDPVRIREIVDALSL